MRILYPKTIEIFKQTYYLRSKQHDIFLKEKSSKYECGKKVQRNNLQILILHTY